MNCSYKTGNNLCQKSGIYTCTSCKNQALYCEEHVEGHNIHTSHEITLIRSTGLSYFKKEIKDCINSIAKNADAVIAEIRRASLNAIFQLKNVNKNIKRVEELTLKSFDLKRISFLIEQARQIDHEMNESPFETSEKLSNMLKSNEIIIQNHQREIHTLSTEVKTLKEKLVEKETQLKQMSQPAPQPAPQPRSNTLYQGTNYKGFSQKSLDEKKRYCERN